MNNIINIKKVKQLAKQLQTEKKRVVLAGGCFDILHIGHITFLGKAKKQGEILIILLENDETIKKIKGKNRPINSQQDRAKMLIALKLVDYVILLPPLPTNKTYDEMILELKPDIIAVTKGDLARKHKTRQAKLSGARVVEVTNNISNNSTSRLLQLLGDKNNL